MAVMRLAEERADQMAQRKKLPALARAVRLEGTGDVRRTAVLAVGDVVVFLVFAGVGRASHSEAAGLNALAQVAQTAAPFALGWFVVAPWLGGYRWAATNSPRTLLIRTWLAWLGAWPVALLLRWAFTGKAPPPTFALVTLFANALFLSIWRGLFALVVARRRVSGGSSPAR
jgi:hypothetical protein